jgi:4-hydroxy-tetrahydrodipicolinate synthase
MSSPTLLRGVYTALVTPFTQDGSAVDVAALEALVERQIAAGVSGLIPCGTTGESPTLSETEHLLVVKRTASVARGRVPVIAGTGSFSTPKTIATCRASMEAGADGVMVVMPYYSRPTQAGLVEHIAAVAQAVTAPVILYNHPLRTGVDLSAASTQTICERSPNVMGLKDATGNVVRCQELVLRLGDRLVVMSGDDALALPMMACGARGLISTASNLYPAEVSEVCRHALEGRWEQARRAHFALLRVYEAMFVESSPAPLKFAMSQKRLTTDAVREPLLAATPEARSKVLEAIRNYEARA